MATKKLVPIKIADVTNNCPKCYSADLKLTFYQKHIFRRFSKRITNEITNEVQCKTCNEKIYPIDWTPELEQVISYYYRAAKPEKPMISYKPIFYILVLVFLGSIAGLIYLIQSGVITIWPE
ncbi:MAG: hypothetical protein OIF50_09440 [Flavobacteriaceae bacterium]|nr:hypothetical protein [Flavobacteriaceae bacterium]